MRSAEEIIIQKFDSLTSDLTSDLEACKKGVKAVMKTGVFGPDIDYERMAKAWVINTIESFLNNNKCK
jgi:hypothetical protein